MLDRIQEMIENGEPIYVINRSGRVLDKSHLLVLEFPNPTGGRGSTVKIPPIKYPINLSRRVAPPQAIPMSRSFVDWVNRGVLEIVPPERARDILSDPDAQAAVNRAFAKINRKRGAALAEKERPKFKVRHGGARETRAVSDLDEAGLSVADFYGHRPEDAHRDSESVVSPKALEVTAETARIGPKIQQFCEDLAEDPNLKQDYLQELKSWDENDLTEDELGYMLQNLRAFENISSYLRSIMAQRAGEVVDTPKRSRRKGKRRKKTKNPSAEELVDDWSDADEE